MRELDAARSILSKQMPPLGNDPIDLVSRAWDRRRTRRADAALRACVDSYWALTPAVQAELAEVGRPRWPSVLAPFLSGQDAGTRAAAADIAIRSGRAAHLASALDAALGLLGAPQSDIAERAISALEAESGTLFDPGVRVSLTRAATDLPRHRSESLSRIILLGTSGRHTRVPGDPLAAWFANADDACVMLLRRALHTLPGEAGTARAIELLANEQFAAAALERIGSIASSVERRLLADQAHLLRRPSRSARADQLAERGGLGAALPALSGSDGLPVDVRRAAASVLALHGAEESVADALLPTIADEDALVRWQASRRSESLTEFVFDSDSQVRRSAVLRLTNIGRRDGTAARVLAPVLSRSGDAWVRRAVRQERAAAEPWDPNSALSRLEARRRLAQDELGFVRELCGRIRPQDDARCLAGMLMSKRLGVVGLCREALQGVLRRTLAGEGEAPAKLAATAISCLDVLREPKLLPVYWLALRHADHRVRSNALEAVARIEGGERLIENKDDAHHRVRATTLKLIAGQAPSVSARGMVELLESDDELPVRAGLWAAEGTLGTGNYADDEGWIRVAARVNEHARSEHEPIRRRAVRTARRSLLGSRATRSREGLVVAGVA